MSEMRWQELHIGNCLSDSFAGEWGSEPNPSNARVLRATDINNEGQVNLSGGALRRIPTKKILEKRLLKGDIILEGSGGSPDQPVGRVAFFPGIQGKGDFLCSNFFRTLRPDPNVVDPRFFFWKLMWFYTQPKLLTLQQQTTGLINLKFDEYKTTAITIPEYIVEQQKIAQVIDALDEAIHQTEAVVEKLMQVKQGLLHDLLTRGVDANGELRPNFEEAPELYQESPLGWIPKEWEIKAIAQIGTVVGGGTPSREVPSFWRGEIPWLTPGEVSKETEKYLHDTRDHISPSGLAGSGANLLPKGSLMVTTRATLGARIINATPMATNQGFKSIIFKRSEDANYYYHAFNRLEPELIRRSSGTTFLEISGAEFSAMQVPSPQPSEKDLIAQMLDTADQRIADETAQLRKLVAQKLGLMDDLLTGRVRVTPLLAQ